MWCHLPTVIRRSLVLFIIVLTITIVALTTTLFFARAASAVTTTNKSINFQGRLLTADGSVVPDGNYNIQFKLYQGGTGTVAGNPSGTLQWTETYTNTGSETGVEVTNGFLSVNLGSKTTFGSSVDWSDDTIWLSMNIAGSAAGCSTFNAGTCVADGEMLPMKQITATPYAISAGSLNGKTAENFVQLAQGVQNDATTNTSSIFINKTGTGNLIQLQNSAADIFTIDQTGNLALGSNADKSIAIDISAADTAGRKLTISAGDGGAGTGATGGDLVLQGGNAGGTDGDAGNVQLDTGTATGTGTAGTIAIGSTNAGTITIGSTATATAQDISIGSNNTVGSTTNLTLGSGGSASAGTTTVQAKDAVTIDTNGTTRATFSGTDNTVYFGNGVSASAPNDFTLQGTGSSTTDVSGGSLSIQGGGTSTGNANGGNVVLAGGVGSGTGANGLVILGTPTFATVIDDVNCYTSGALVASSCTIAASSVNNSAAVLVGFSVAGQIATLPDPTIATAGRIVYVTGANGSESFKLAINGGGAGNTVTLHANTTATMIWNGSDWTAAGASNATTLQDTYDNTRTGSADLVLNNTDGAFAISDSATDSITGALLSVSDAATNVLFSVSSDAAYGANNVQIGTGVSDSNITLLTVDKAASAPTILNDALLGSMYYDTTLGKLQCYEASGWGSCGSSPDTFITLSPEYSNAVVRTNGTGTMTTDLCSDSLDINDGSSAQPTVCGTNETFNYYNWTSASLTDQTRSIYVSYQLPSTFKNFVSGETSMLGRTDSTDSTVNYQVYRNTSAGLTACGTTTTVSTGVKTTWQEVAATSTADPANCSFAAGDSVVFRINLGASVDANAYASNLNFAYSNQ
jgi:hypothetical protein